MTSYYICLVDFSYELLIIFDLLVHHVNTRLQRKKHFYFIFVEFDIVNIK